MHFILASLSSPGAELISLGPLKLRWYGLLIAFSLLIGINISNRLARFRNLDPNLINDLIPVLVLSSLIGARLYYVAFKWENYIGINFWSSIHLFGIEIPIPTFLEIWNGGIAIHGALIMGIFSVIIFSFFRKQNAWDLVDVLLPSVSLGQAIGRWGNFFNNEAFGLPTNLPWKLFIPDSSRPAIFSAQSFFHPTFLYESILNICIFLLLISIFRFNVRGAIKLPSGSLSCIYLILYSLGRLWIEGLRIDPLCLGGVPPFCEGGIRIAQLISSLFIFIGSFGLWWIYKAKKKLPILGGLYKR